MDVVRVRSTSHDIGGQLITFSVLTSTKENTYTREVVITDAIENTAVLRFGHDDFQLFKSILKEF